MTTVETAKLIRQELKATYPEYYFRVRKEDAGVIRVYHYIDDLNVRTGIDQWLQKFVGWNEFQTEYVFEARA